MKISKELLSTIRAVCLTKRREAKLKVYSSRVHEEEAVNRLTEINPKVRRARWESKQLRRQAEKLLRRADAMLKKFGLASYGPYIASGPDAAKAFVRAGGVMPVPPKSPPNAEFAIASLAGASEREAGKILDELGIVWPLK